MSSRNHSPSGDTANVVGPIAAPEDLGASFVLRFTAVGETVDIHASQGLWADL